MKVKGQITDVDSGKNIVDFYRKSVIKTSTTQQEGDSMPFQGPF
jgi:hypothetical protein